MAMYRHDFEQVFWTAALDGYVKEMAPQMVQVNGTFGFLGLLFRLEHRTLQ